MRSRGSRSSPSTITRGRRHLWVSSRRDGISQAVPHDLDQLAWRSCSASVASWIWVLRRLLRDAASCPRGRSSSVARPPWGWGTVLLVFLAYLRGQRRGLPGYALATRGLPETRGSAGSSRETRCRQDRSGGDGRPARQDRPGADRPATARADHPLEDEAHSGRSVVPELMSVQAAINSLLIVLLPLILRMTSGARLRDLGLSSRRLAAPGGHRRRGRACALADRLRRPGGSASAAWMSPTRSIEPIPCRRCSGRPDRQLAYLAVLTAVLLAPVFEELLFRGILQSWLIQAPERPGSCGLRRRRWHARFPSPRPARD